MQVSGLLLAAFINLLSLGLRGNLISKLPIEEVNANTYGDGIGCHLIPEENVDAAWEKSFSQ